MGAHSRASAAPKKGDILQTDSLSMLLASHDYTTGESSSIKQALNLSAVVGLHYYLVDRVRFGMGVQFTERIWPQPPPGSSRFQRFALMPQLGWSFHDPFYTALIFSYAPRTLGRAEIHREDGRMGGPRGENLGFALPPARRETTPPANERARVGTRGPFAPNIVVALATKISEQGRGLHRVA